MERHNRLCKDMLQKVYIIWNGKGEMQVMLEFHETNRLLSVYHEETQYRLSVSDFSSLARSLKIRYNQERPPRMLFCCFQEPSPKTSIYYICRHNYDLMKETAETIQTMYHQDCHV